MAESVAQPAQGPWGDALQRYFELALYLLVCAGFATLASTGGLGIVSLLLGGAALVFRGYLYATRRTLLLPERWTSRLTLVYVFFFLIDYFVLSRLFVPSVVHLVLFLTVVRIFSARRDRDYYFIAVIAFLMVLSAAVLTVDSVFLLGFAVFLLMAVASFILMEMKNSSTKAAVHFKDKGDQAAHRRMALSVAGTTPVIVLLVMLGAGAIFFVLPRVSAGYLSAYAPTSGFSTAFSDRVELGSIGEIQQSSAVVMHIEIDGDTYGDHNLKWRGVSLSQFDGKSWTNPYRARPIPPIQKGEFDLRRSSERLRPLSGNMLHYRVLSEPMGTEIFFVANRLQVLQGNYRLIARDYGGAIFNWDPAHSVSLYEADSDTSQPDAEELRNATGDYPQGFEDFLRTPPLDSRVVRLTQEITASASNNFDKAVALERYLSTHFGYTLQLPTARPADPIAYFLFERKQGHCEFFASAMAVMLRTIHIPSRVVTGFTTGEFNDVTAQYVIRASNAHAWVEAYFPGYGWIAFDPTPPSGRAVRSGWGRMGLYVDAMASFWREWVVEYDAGHQRTLGEETARNAREFVVNAQSWARRHYAAWLVAARKISNDAAGAPTRWGLRIGIGAFLLFLLVNAPRIWHWVRTQRLAIHPERSPRRAASLWYERLIGKLGRRGFRKTAAQTPNEFAGSIPDPALREKVVRFTRHYEKARFGESTEDAQRLPEVYEEVFSTPQR